MFLTDSSNPALADDPNWKNIFLRNIQGGAKCDIFVISLQSHKMAVIMGQFMHIFIYIYIYF